MAGRTGASQLHYGFLAAVLVLATSGIIAYARLFDRHSLRGALLSCAGILKRICIPITLKSARYCR